jgi:ABC-type glycerol-3-phosphate transport system permease component
LSYGAVTFGAIVSTLQFCLASASASASIVAFALDDAAMLDGANWFPIYWNVVLPNAGLALRAAEIFQFTGEWNAHLEPFIYR